jgi:hypothetical protein
MESADMTESQVESASVHMGRNTAIFCFSAHRGPFYSTYSYPLSYHHGLRVRKELEHLLYVVTQSHSLIAPLSLSSTTPVLQ